MDTSATVEAILAADYNDTPEQERLSALDCSAVWEALLQLEDANALRAVAAGARTDAIRWKACTKLGGHFYDGTGPTRCRCTLCGLERHTAPSDALPTRWTCTVCGCEILMLPIGSGFPRVRVRYRDGTNGELRGSDGILYGEHRFADRHGLA